MKSTKWIVMLLSVPLLNGCVTPEYCDVADIIPFGSQATVNYLYENDERLLRDIVENNREHERFCP